MPAKKKYLIDFRAAIDHLAILPNLQFLRFLVLSVTFVQIIDELSISSRLNFHSANFARGRKDLSSQHVNAASMLFFFQYNTFNWCIIRYQLLRNNHKQINVLNLQIHTYFEKSSYLGSCLGFLLGMFLFFFYFQQLCFNFRRNKHHSPCLHRINDPK